MPVKFSRQSITICPFGEIDPNTNKIRIVGHRECNIQCPHTGEALSMFDPTTLVGYVDCKKSTSVRVFFDGDDEYVSLLDSNDPPSLIPSVFKRKRKRSY